MLYVDVPLVGGSVSSHKQLSLYERMGLLRSILASSCSIDDYIQVEMYSDNHGRDPSTIKIQRYDGCFINKNDHLQIDLEGAITFPLTRRNEVIVKAVSLKNISNVPISLSQDVLGYNLDSLHDSDAPWLVFGILDDAIRIQPILLGSSIQYEEASPLLNALCSMGTKEYHRVIHGVLSSIESNPFHADFYELAQLMKAYKANHDLPLLLIGLFRELRNYPVTKTSVFQPWVDYPVTPQVVVAASRNHSRHCENSNSELHFQAHFSPLRSDFWKFLQCSIVLS